MTARRRGFTLLETLLVAAIVALTAGIVFAAGPRSAPDAASRG